jgi:hypothetical protein
MTTRSIVTSQPDVACDVCARRLLRGEQHDIFLAAGRRRTVCELCAPRAAHEGWMRETDQALVTLPPMRPRRGRSFIDRLRQAAATKSASETTAAQRASRRAAGVAETPYDLFGESAQPHSAEAPFDGIDVEHPIEQAPAKAPTPPYLQEAIDVFNAGEYPRRVAGVARSLGAPVVSVRSSEHLASIVRLVVAWELCWYRYEVDLGDPESIAEAIGQGTEVSELEPEEREGNAIAHESGVLAFAQ